MMNPKPKAAPHERVPHAATVAMVTELLRKDPTMKNTDLEAALGRGHIEKPACDARRQLLAEGVVFPAGRGVGPRPRESVTEDPSYQQGYDAFVAGVSRQSIHRSDNAQSPHEISMWIRGWDAAADTAEEARRMLRTPKKKRMSNADYAEIRRKQKAEPPFTLGGDGAVLAVRTARAAPKAEPVAPTNVRMSVPDAITQLRDTCKSNGHTLVSVTVTYNFKSE